MANASDLCAGTWQEVIYKRMKATNKLSKEISSMIERIVHECNPDGIMDDLDEWFEAFNKKIHIPVWNKITERTPDDLDIPIEAYVVTYKDDQQIHFEANWNSDKKQFYTWSDEEETHVPLANAYFWIPLVYPEIW